MPFQLGRVPNGLHDFDVAGASAEIAGNRLLDLEFGRVWVLIQKSLPSQNHPRRTKAALDGSVFNKGLLKGMKLSISAETLDGQDFFPPERHRESETG